MFRPGSTGEMRRAFRRAPRINWKDYHHGVLVVARFLTGKPRLTKPQQATAHLALLLCYVGLIFVVPSSFAFIAPILAMGLVWLIGDLSRIRRRSRAIHRRFQEWQDGPPFPRELE